MNNFFIIKSNDGFDLQVNKKNEIFNIKIIHCIIISIYFIFNIKIKFKLIILTYFIYIETIHYIIINIFYICVSNQVNITFY